MRDATSMSEAEYHSWLKDNPENRCFEQVIPRANALQDAARFLTIDRSYIAKYPGHGGEAIRGLTAELLRRIAPAEAQAASSAA
jgi:chromosome partitioning protein